MAAPKRPPSLYELLGVPAAASSDDIKQSYKSLAKQLHPDVNPDPAAAERFKVINDAYAVLSDDDKRRAYDVRFSVESIPGFEELRRAGTTSATRAQVAQYHNLRRQALELPKTSARRLLFMLSIPTAFLLYQLRESKDRTTVVQGTLALDEKPKNNRKFW